MKLTPTEPVTYFHKDVFSLTSQVSLTGAEKIIVRTNQVTQPRSHSRITNLDLSLFHGMVNTENGNKGQIKRRCWL